MNIVFWLLVVVTLVICWFLLSFTFKGIGSWVLTLFNDAKRGIEDDDSEEYFEE